MHGSEYNAEISDDSLKSDYHFDFPNNSRTVVSDTTNSATNVAKYFSEDAKQVNCEMHQLNGAMKYVFGLLENKKLTMHFLFKASLSDTICRYKSCYLDN